MNNVTKYHDSYNIIWLIIRNASRKWNVIFNQKLKFWRTNVVFYMEIDKTVTYLSELTNISGSRTAAKTSSFESYC